MSVNWVSVEIFVYITQPAIPFYAFDFLENNATARCLSCCDRKKKLKKSFLSFLVFSTEMSPTKRKRCHKVTNSSDEEDDASRPGAHVNVRPRAQ
jgi:hypothetical protein